MAGKYKDGHKKVSNLESPSAFSGTDMTSKAKEISKDISNTVSDLKTQVMGAAKTGADKIRDGVAYVKDSVKMFEDTITEFKSEALQDISNLIKGLTGDWIDLGDLGDIVKFENGKLSFDTDELMGRISDQVGVDLSSMDALKQDIADKMFKEFNDLTDGKLGELYTLDGTKLTFTGQNWGDENMRQLVDLLDRIGVDPYKDTRNPDFDLAFNNVLLEQVVGNGMTDAFKPIYDRYDNEEEAQAAVINCFDYVIQTGDYYSLVGLSELLWDSNIPKVSSRYPTMGQDFLRNYRFGRDDRVGEYEDIAKGVKAELVKLTGKEFWKSTTLFGVLPDFTIGGTMSQDACDIFVTDKDLAVFVCATGLFFDEPAIEVFRRDFPDAVMLDD